MKTISLKKVSAVAVASLGFGLLSVVPAQATSLAANKVTVAAKTSFYKTTVIGTAATNVFEFSTLTAQEANDEIIFTAAVATAPVGSTATPTLTKTDSETPAKYTLSAGTTAAKVKAVMADNTQLSNQDLGTLSFTPDVPGKYQLTVTAVSYAAAALTTEIANNVVGKLTIYATGTGASVASAGIGSTTVSAVAGGQAKINFAPALTNNALSSANLLWTVSVGGVGSMQNTSGTFAVVPTDGVGANDAMTNAGGTIASPSTGFAKPTNGTTADWSSGATLGNGSTTTPFEFIITTTSPVVGTQTITISAISASTGAPTLVSTTTITWAAAAAGASASYSTSFIATGTSCGVADATAANLTFSRTAGTVANICITVKDTNGNAMVGQALTATIAGPGLIKLTSGTSSTAAGDVRAGSLTSTDQASASTAKIVINSDGTSGTSTITISNGTTVLATETLYFYGTVATLTATQNLKVARAGTSGYELGTSDGSGQASAATTAALTPAVVIVAKDSAGIVVPGLTITGLSSDTTVIASATVAQAAGATGTTGAAGPGTYLASVTSAGNGTSGKTATVTFRTQLSTGAYISAAPVTFTLGGTLALGKETIAFDKTSYAPGEAMTVTVTAKDSAGNAVYDGVTSPSLTASKAIGGTLPSGFYVGGVVKNTANTLFAPALGGSFSVNGTSGNDAEDKITASASVTDANAGLLTQIDALNAKIVALNALIAKIMKKLGVK